MSKEIDIQQLDQRTVARYLERGLLSQKDYDKYVASLPDMSSEAVKLELKQPSKGDSSK